MSHLLNGVLWTSVTKPRMLPYIFLLLSLPVIALATQQIPVNEKTASPFTAHFDKLVAQSLHRWHTPGLAIAVIDGQETFCKVRCHFSTEESGQIRGFVLDNKILSEVDS